MNKKILYIGTPIFNYHKKIITEFENQEYSVDFYNDRPSENSFIKGIIKIKKEYINSFIQKYFVKIMNETKMESYDIVFIVNCKVFTPMMIKQLRDSQKSARFILYMWDSLTLYPNSKELISIFDKAYSFDTEDCEKTEKLQFLPLFYCDEFRALGQADINEMKYDIASVCTAHPNRYKLMNALFPKLEKEGIRIFSYMFLHRFQYLYNKVFIPEFKYAKSREFKFKPLSEEENLNILKISNSVFDMQHNKQSGLTMRSIETLGAKKKLITTNKNIKKYDFYNENNIFVIDESDLAGIELFIKNEYEPISDKIYKKYSLHSWIKIIINESDNKYFR
ncbi:MAG: hypothetical protein WCI30_02045 [Clostridia bacterium]